MSTQFIGLTFRNGKKAIVNLRYIVAIEEQNNQTKIVLRNTTCFVVETLSQINENLMEIYNE